MYKQHPENEGKQTYPLLPSVPD